MNTQPPYYLQTDARWRNIDYSAAGESTTIGKAGCGPTACAMAISAILGKEVLPPETAKWLKAKGYKAKGQGTYYSGIVAVMKHYGITCRQITGNSVYHTPNAEAHATALKALKNGDLVIACMGKGIWTSSGHFVLAWKVDNTRVYINDSNSKKDMRMCNLISTWQNEVKHYFIVTVPKMHLESEATTVKEVDDELIENKTIPICGQEFNIPTIFKENQNFVSIRGLCDALGFQITSEGNRPIVSEKAIVVEIKGEDRAMPGMILNGNNFVKLRPFAEACGLDVSHQGSKAIIN